MFDTADFIDFIKSTREELTEKHKANLVNLVDLDEKLKQQIKVSSPFLHEDAAKTERAFFYTVIVYYCEAIWGRIITSENCRRLKVILERPR